MGKHEQDKAREQKEELKNQRILISSLPRASRLLMIIGNPINMK